MKAEPTRIAWKIITEGRHSGYVANVITWTADMGAENERYRFRYPLHTVVKVPHLGSFCFNTRENAENYMRNDGHNPRKIVKVLGIGKPTKPRKIGYADTVAEFYRQGKSFQPVPTGTICFKAIIPLE